jgi:MFS family permease
MATGLFLIGFGVGALFAGPFSETLGRNPVREERKRRRKKTKLT